MHKRILIRIFHDPAAAEEWAHAQLCAGYRLVGVTSQAVSGEPGGPALLTSICVTLILPGG